MRTTDTSENGLENLIVQSLNKEGGYQISTNADYDREHALDLSKLLSFIEKTQPNIFEALQIEEEGHTRTRFLHRLQGEIAKRGVIDVLRRGISHGPTDVTLYFQTPTPGNITAKEQFESNIFSLTRQLQYSDDGSKLALDLAIFINGLPIATFELKNNLTKQTVQDAVRQYRTDRDPKERLFEFGRCLVHFAVDDKEVEMCTHLKGASSWFLPFNKGYRDGAGNPPNPNGIATDYLWKTILRKDRLADIIENYAQLTEIKDDKGRKRRNLIFPRYHQLDAVRKLLADAQARGAGHRYLIQHSAGSGKSNSIAWLAHQLVSLTQEDGQTFDSIIVVTDRKNLDKQIKNTIKQFAQVGAVVGHADSSKKLGSLLSSGKKIIISTVQKFPFILDSIGNQHRRSKFAIIIDEAHSSQGGKTTAKMHMALGDSDFEEEEEPTTEDMINTLMASRKMLTNASYFAFTATPKNKTLEIFGEPIKDGDTVKRRPFHSYTMKQAIQEGFILDVLKNYTPVECYYRLERVIEGDPEFDTKKAKKKLRKYVESHSQAIREKSEIMVDHFHDNVIGQRKIGGEARAMVVCSGIQRAIEYYHNISDYLREIKSPYKAIVAFSGEHEHGKQKVSESSLNGFPSSQIEDKLREDPYRFLIVANKFLTGFDEPLLHTMYVDKPLSGIKAVQTLSRLNRAHPKKDGVFVLDFANSVDTIRAAFSDYYRTTILSDETDPNKLHDLKADLDGYQVYSQTDINTFVERYLSEGPRDTLDPILDACVATYNEELDEDGQVDFKGKAKTFARTYSFLASILPYSNAPWEKLSTFLNFLIPKLPAPKEEDLSKGILETIDMDSYRIEVKSRLSIDLADEEAEIEPVPTLGGGRKAEAELDHLSSIVREFNELFGNIEWKDEDKIRKVIFEDIPAKIRKDKAYQNALQNSDKQNARIEHDRALGNVMLDLLSDHTELFRRFSDDPNFKRFLSNWMFDHTYREQPHHPQQQTNIGP